MPRGPSAATIRLRRLCTAILREIQPASVRAVCYQLFIRHALSSMAKTETNRISYLLTRAREAGVIPWEWIVDESRTLEDAGTWASPRAYFAAVQAGYRRDRWQTQPRRLEVWSEKGTVRGTLRPLLDAYGIDFRVMHGYGSATVVHDIAEDSARLAQPLLVLYVGDWDPSGAHMSEEDLPGRLGRYSGYVEVRRIAILGTDARHTAGLPGFPAEEKAKDKRYPWFIRRYPPRCWELDAMNPNTLRGLVEAAIRAEIDWPAWEHAGRVDEAERAAVTRYLAAWEDAADSGGPENTR